MESGFELTACVRISHAEQALPIHTVAAWGVLTFAESLEGGCREASLACQPAPLGHWHLPPCRPFHSERPGPAGSADRAQMGKAAAFTGLRAFPCGGGLGQAPSLPPPSAFSRPAGRNLHSEVILLAGPGEAGWEAQAGRPCPLLWFSRQTGCFSDWMCFLFLLPKAQKTTANYCYLFKEQRKRNQTVSYLLVHFPHAASVAEPTLPRPPASLAGMQVLEPSPAFLLPCANFWPEMEKGNDGMRGACG